MRLLPCLICCLATFPAAGADDKPAASPVRAGLEAATQARVQASAEVNRAYDELNAANLPGATKAAREQAIDDRWDAAIVPSMEALLAAATDHPGDPASVEALGFVALNARGRPSDLSLRAIRILRRDHARAANISAATRTMFVHEGKPEAIDLIRAVVAENPSRAERGRAAHDLAWLLQYRASRIERRRDQTSSPPPAPHLQGVDPAPIRAEVEALYDRCVAEFADVPLVGYGAGKTVGDFARGALVDLRSLRVGLPAPEIVGQDVDGHPLRLTDHRGKAVVLVFSGEWCGPCRANAGFLRDLLAPEAQARTPCVVLEVNTDKTPDPVRQAMAAGAITWPCWMDGDVTGPITLAWGVEEFPRFYVLDAAGIIRGKDVDGKALAAVVARTVAEHPADRRP